MLFRKINVLIKILFLFISINIITAVDRDQDPVAGPSGSQPSEDLIASKFPENITTSSEETDEDYKGTTLCWFYMEDNCRMKNPEAIDFVKMAIANWTKFDLQYQRPIHCYYQEIKDYVDAGEILSPYAYCDKFDDKDAPKRKDGRTECQLQLSFFGKTNHEALLYGLYETKLEPYGKRVIDTVIMVKIFELLKSHPDFRKQYLFHMIENVKLHGEVDSPLEFCKAYDKYELIGKKITVD